MYVNKYVHTKEEKNTYVNGLPVVKHIFSCLAHSKLNISKHPNPRQTFLCVNTLTSKTKYETKVKFYSTMNKQSKIEIQTDKVCLYTINTLKFSMKILICSFMPYAYSNKGKIRLMVDCVPKSEVKEISEKSRTRILLAVFVWLMSEH